MNTQIRIVPGHEDLSRTLTRSRRSQLMGKVANLRLEIDLLKEDRKGINEEIKGLDEEIDKHCKAVRLGVEKVKVAIQEVWDFEAKEIRTITADTKEVLRVRPMTDEDRQKALPFASARRIPISACATGWYPVRRYGAGPRRRYVPNGYKCSHCGAVRSGPGGNLPEGWGTIGANGNAKVICPDCLATKLEPKAAEA